MNFRIIPTLRLLITLTSLAFALPAQELEEDVVRSKMDAVRRMREEEGEGDRLKLEDREREEWANLTPEQRLERRTRRGASQHCQFVASCRPAKLMPGQSGTMVVAALLKGSAVIPAPAPVELLRAIGDAPVDVGQLSVRPAQLGASAQAYVGKPVYENYAWFEIPVTMRPDAKIGDKHRLAVDLKFDLYDGGSAMPVGRFLEQVMADIEVGLDVDPGVVGRREPSVAPDVRQVESAGPAKVAADPETRVSGDVIKAGVEPVPAAPAVPAVKVPESGDSQFHGDSLPAAADDGLPMPLLVGGGVFALLLVLLLVIRRK